MPSRRSISLRKQRSRQLKALMAVGGLALGGVIGMAVKRTVDALGKKNADIEQKMDDTLANLKKLMASYKANQAKQQKVVTAESSELEKEVVRLRAETKNMGELKKEVSELQQQIQLQLQANTTLENKLETLDRMIQDDQAERAAMMTELQQELKKEKQAYEDEIKQLKAENTRLKEGAI